MRPCRLITAHSTPLRARTTITPLPGASGIVRGAQQARLARNIIADLALIPDVVAGSQHIQAHAKKLLGDGWREAESASRVLRVGHREIDVVGFHDIRQMVRQHPASRGREDIPNKKNVHSSIHVSTRRPPRRADPHQI